MNGFHNVERFLNDDVSPQSLTPPWATLSTGVSNDLDSRLSRLGPFTPRASDQSSVLFHQLPDEVVERILWATDADGFASICYINKTWYKQSQKVELYAHHLSRCPSYALSNNVITGPFRKNDFPRIKAKFAAEVRRNLFSAYLQPRETHINLISVSANSSAALPGSEAFRFEFSPNGRTILALSSSRIYVLDASGDTIQVQRELKTLRRPQSASVTDDGTLLAVLSSKYQANIYAIAPGNPVKHVQVIVLDNAPRTIALAHEGTVLAAAWQGGIEVFSLAANALSTDRRAVRSEVVDSLMFSGDGSMIIGSSQDLEEPGSVVITAPFYTENDPNITPREIHSRMWTTQILFPQISSTVSHVALLPGHTEGDTNWLFAYDHTLMTYRAVRTDDTRTGVAYFLSPPTAERFEFPQPCIAPVSTACGTLAAAGFADHGLWLYGVPERLDVSPDMGAVLERHEAKMHHRVALTSATGHVEPLMAYSPSVSGSSEMIDMEEEGLAGKVDWRQSLFVKCKSVRGIPGFSSAKWVENTEENPCGFSGKRLIVTAPAGVSSYAEDLGDENMPVDGSRICLLDFDYSPSTGVNREYTIEVGDNEPELLSEQTGNMDIEVAMERRRTVRSARGRDPAASRAALGRALTAAVPTHQPSLDEVVRRPVMYQPSSPSEAIGQDAWSPVTRSSALTRAQTAAGFQSARFPPRPPLATGASGYHDQQNARLPHRPSMDSWETPPPAYGQEGIRPTSGHGYRSQGASNPNRNSSLADSDNATLNGNLQQLGVFANRNQPPSTNQAVPQPQHRNSTTLDGMPTTEAAPSSRHMSQYGAIARTPLPDGIPEESEQFPASPQQMSPMFQSPTQELASQHPTHRPQSQRYESNPELQLRPTMTHPMSPPTPDRTGWLPDPISEPKRISLTGANLQNRLNHLVPPLPEDDSPSNYSQTSSPQPAPQPQPHHYSPPRHSQSYPQPQPPQPQPQPRHVSSFPMSQQSPFAPQIPTVQPAPQIAATDHYSAPSAGQISRLSQRHSYVPPSLQPGRHIRAATAEPPRAAWGATSPTSPSFRTLDAPLQMSRSNSNKSIGASRSTPNLLSSRPGPVRLDTIQSVEDRAHSAVEYSAYDQTRQASDRFYSERAWTDPETKKKKPKKDKGRRCVVM